MPEAYEEAREVRESVCRHHPEWLRQPPDKATYTRHRMDWVRHRGGFWHRVLTSPSTVALHLAALEGDSMAVPRARAYKARAEARDEMCTLGPAWSFENVELAALQGALVSKAGQETEAVSPWRLSAISVLRNQLSPASAYSDWLSPWMDTSIASLSNRGWRRFWLIEVQPTEVPRWWLRWAFEFLQTLRTVTPGTPCDAQLATYLLTCDYFVSADRGLVEIATKVRDHAPFKIGRSFLVPAGSHAVPALLDALRTSQLSVRRAS